MLRAPTQHEVEEMRSWRNHLMNRDVSKRNHEISVEEHLDWCERTRCDPTREVLVLEIDGAPCGVVTYADIDLESSPSRATWGFYLDYDGLARRGAVLVAWHRMMKAAIDHAFDVLNVDVLDAEVLEHNHAVRLTNKRFRFAEGAPRAIVVDGSELTVIPVSLKRECRRTSRGGS